MSRYDERVAAQAGFADDDQSLGSANACAQKARDRFHFTPFLRPSPVKSSHANEIAAENPAGGTVRSDTAEDRQRLAILF